MSETKPEQFADADADPLALGKEALEKLHRVRQGLGAQAAARAYLDEVTELVKQLAHGPESEGPRPAKPAAPVFDVATRSGRGRLGMHRRWHESGKRPCTCRPSPSA